MRDLSLDELAGCNNPNCSFGCGWYQPTGLVPGVPIASTPCAICHCVGGQHRDTSNFKRPAAPTVSTPPVSAPPASAETLSASSSASTFPTSSFSFNESSFASTPSSSTYASEPVASTSFSATARSLFGSRPAGPAPPADRGRGPLPGSTVAPSGFRDLADARKQESIAAMRASGAPFNPAYKAHREADLERAGAKRRKKRADPSPSLERPAKLKVPKYIHCVVILVPFTKEINRGRCAVIPASLLVSIEEAGYVKDISISLDDTAHDIRTKILVNFFHVPGVEEHGFRLLVTHRPMRLDRHGNVITKAGVSRLYRPLKLELDLTAIKIAMVDSNIRLSGPRFRHLVFIALNPAGPNLPLRGFALDKDDKLDHDLASDEMSDSSAEDDSDIAMGDADDTDTESDSPQRPKPRPAPVQPDRTAKAGAQADRKGKQKADAQGSRYEAGYFDEDVAADDQYTGNEPAPPPEPKIEKPVVPQAYHRVVRLLHNMQKPDVKSQRPAIWWAHDTVGCFQLGINSAQICAGILVQFLAAPDQSFLTPPQIVSLIQSNIIRPFSALTKLGGRLLGGTDRLGSAELEAEFDSGFAIGPGGLHGLVPHIISAFLSLPVALKAGAPADTVGFVFDELTELSYSLLRCLQHLRFKHHRSQWDPSGGCRELATVLANKDSDLPVATEEDFARLKMNLLLDALDKEVPNVSQINFLLMDVLGDASNPREMTAERVLKGGEYGMLRFYDLVVVRILDDVAAAGPCICRVPSAESFRIQVTIAALDEFGGVAVLIWQ
ncbi:hypothetical protein C8R46DRAFT_1209756 [Mycena filopes]|nr:hypothetical protein C8R46DRAFT_1209756 [Mycena filopes]